MNTPPPRNPPPNRPPNAPRNPASGSDEAAPDRAVGAGADPGIGARTEAGTGPGRSGCAADPAADPGVRPPGARGGTLSAALARGVTRLRAAGIADPARDARILLAHAAGIAPERILIERDARLGPAAAQAYDAALDARADRRPVSQITGQRLFWGRSFRVTSDVLDPRPETETLVAAALEEPFAKVLDLGTGSGAILLSLLAERPAATGLGCDISAAALAVAAENACALGLEQRAKLVESDWFAAVAERFDLVVSNPPYIAAAEIEGLAPEVRLWEPHVALSPGGDGLGAYRRIAADVSRHLRPGGRLLVEIGAGQGPAVTAIFVAAGLVGIATRDDLDGRARVVTARAP